MKNTKKGILQFLFTLIVVGLIGLYLVLGYDNDKMKGVDDIGLGLDLSGGLSITYETEIKDPDSDKLDMTVYRMQRRVENYSTEATVYKQGRNRIICEIPGVTNAEEILADLGNAGNVYFIYGQSLDGVDNIKLKENGKDYELARPIEEIVADKNSLVLDGADIAKAEAQYSQGDIKNGKAGTQYFVQLTLKDAGPSKFLTATTNVSQYYSSAYGTKGILAIVYDNEVISAPRCEQPINSNTAVINGDFTLNEVKSLANTINIGALPLELNQLQYSIVGAQLGTNALETILLAGLIGIILVMIFMIVMYRLPGICSTLALIFYMEMIVLVFIVFDTISLTLPGIAGIILSVGMAVDGNVIIYSRIREELRAGKTVRSSIKIGFEKATSAIVDGNVTTLIAAIVLYLRGSGTVRSFAITLGIGIILSMISSLLVTRFLMTCFYNLGFDKEKFYGVAKETKVINFTKHSVKYAAFSLCLIVIGFVAMIVNNNKHDYILNYGLDFVGGTAVEVYFDETPPTNKEIEDATSDILGGTPQVVQVEGENAVIIKTDKMIEEGTTSKDDKSTPSNADISDSTINKLKKVLEEKFGAKSDKIQVDSISATVSDEMKTDAIMAVIIAGICMLIYIWIRFRNLSFAGSAVLALMHDVLVVLMVYAVFRITVDNAFIAVMLTIVGYSINATIVIFDRIRENMASKSRKDSLDDVVNRSISETLSRSINTSLTTMFSILMIIFLGVDSIRAFAIPLMVGLICGTYSSVCITGSLWLFFKKHSKNNTEAVTKNDKQSK